VRYDSFRGTLPNITQVRLQLVGASFNIESASISGVSCRYTTSAREPAFGPATVVSGTVTGLGAEGSIASSTFLCPRGRFGAATPGRVVLTGTTNAITVTLVA
jgi:hypothetical protein